MSTAGDHTGVRLAASRSSRRARNKATSIAEGVAMYRFWSSDPSGPPSITYRLIEGRPRSIQVHGEAVRGSARHDAGRVGMARCELKG
jgi:hypothetical protein